ncbi:hypothetical protein LINPERPRIM_LOCUS3266 [Linum perenne]
MVRGTSLSKEGRCSKVSHSKIVVEDVGVSDRIQFLQRCVVFRLVSSLPEAVPWPSFRAWIAKNWGVEQSSQILQLGEDAWLLVCGSKSVADRIVALKRVEFGSTRVYLDSWTAIAGCMPVTQGLKTEWVCVRGIPLHLRSIDLFVRLRDVCGGYVEYDEKECNLNSVRLKVRVGQERPTKVSLSFKGFRVWFSGESEHGDDCLSKEVQVPSASKGKGVALETVF